MNIMDSWRVCLAYYAQKMEDKTYLLLGRDHKPLGCLGNSGSNWNEHPIGYVLTGLTSQIAAEISYCGDPNVERIYFYNGSCQPWRGKKYAEAHDKRVTMFLALARNVLRPERRAEGSG
jgi:hypothetical protein